MGWQVVRELRPLTTREDATSTLGGVLRLLLAPQQLVWGGRGTCCKNIPCLWRQTLHFLGKSLPYLQKEQRPLFQRLVRFWCFETSQLMLRAGSWCSIKWCLMIAQRKFVLEWLTFAFRRFCLCDFMPPSLRALGEWSFFLAWQLEGCWHWQWTIIFSHQLFSQNHKH